MLLPSSIYIFYDESQKGVIYFWDETNKILNYPLLISSPNIPLSQNIIKSLSNKLNKDLKNRSILFIPVNYSTEEYFKTFYSDLKKNLVDFETSYSNDFDKISQFKNIIILLASGKTTRNEVIRLKKILSLGGNVIGCVFDEE